MKLTALGVGDAFSARHYSTCMLLEHDGWRLMIDCPHPIRKVLKEARPDLDLVDIHGVLLTHLHADHCSGLEGFGFFNHFVRGGPLPLLAHPRVSARVWERLAPGMDALVPEVGAEPVPRALGDYWALVNLDLERPVHFGPFEIECRFTVHHLPTTALRIRAGGACVGYSADTAFDPDLVAWLEVADQVVHESNHGIHTPLSSLLALDAGFRGKLHIVHYPDDLDVERCPLPCLRQGQQLDILPGADAG